MSDCLGGDDGLAVDNSKACTVPTKILRKAAEYMNTYSAKTGREACGLVMTWRDPDSGTTVWSWQGVANVDPSPEHNFTLEPMRTRGLLAALDQVGGRVHAVVHSHPFADMGGPGWNGPSMKDVQQKAKAELEEAAAHGDMDFRGPVEAVVFLPFAGEAGRFVSFDGGGAFLWLNSL